MEFVQTRTCNYSFQSYFTTIMYPASSTMRLIFYRRSPTTAASPSFTITARAKSYNGITTTAFILLTRSSVLSVDIY